MRAKMLSYVATSGRSVSGFAAPALVVGLLLVSQSYGLIQYPRGPAGALERSIDSILAREQRDILRENALVRTQNAIDNVLDVLNVKLQNATNPNEIARLEQQIAAKQAQFQNFQQAIDRNGQLLLRDMNVLNPAKDQALASLSGVRGPRKQIGMFITAATQREQTYVALIQRFLRAHPVSPISPF